MLLTDREFAGGYNRVEAIDTRLKLDDHWSVQRAGDGQPDAASRTARAPEATRSISTCTGRAATTRYDLQYIDRGEGFRTDLGFVTRVDMRQVQQFAEPALSPQEQDRALVRAELLRDGQLRSQGRAAGLAGESGLQYRNGAQYVLQRGTMERPSSASRTSTSGSGGSGFGGHSEYFKRATIDASYNRSTHHQLQSRRLICCPSSPHERDVQADLTFRPTARLKLEEIYYYTDLRTRDATVFVNHLARSRLNYQFTRELFAAPDRGLQRCAGEPFAGQPRAAEARHRRCAGYVPDSSGHRAVPRLYGSPGKPAICSRACRRTVATIGFPSTTTARQFFAKVSYLFRF